MYYDPYAYGNSGMMNEEALFLLFMGIYLVALVVIVLYSICAYIINAVGLYTMAKRRGINHSWLAWLPIGNTWVLGCISDQYQYVVKGKNRSRRKLLLGLNIGTAVAVIVYYIACYSFLFGMMEEITYHGAVSFAEIIDFIGAFMLLWLMLLAVAVVTAVFTYIAYYDLFVSSRPKAAVVFLIVGIVFSFVMPWFVFACRKKDDGMPPRCAPQKPQAPVQVQSVLTQPTVQIVGPTDVVADESDFETE